MILQVPKNNRFRKTRSRLFFVLQDLLCSFPGRSSREKTTVSAYIGRICIIVRSEFSRKKKQSSCLKRKIRTYLDLLSIPQLGGGIVVVASDITFNMPTSCQL